MHLRLAVLSTAAALGLAVSACGDAGERSSDTRGGGTQPLAGSIRIDGSAAVAPLTRAIAARFTARHPDVRVAVGRSGTDPGFKRFCRGETDANDASRAIDAQTIDACERGGVAWERITVADDAVVVFVDRTNPVRCVTTDQLRQIWRGNSNVTTAWSQVGGIDASYDEHLQAWGPGTDTETFFAFTEAVNGVRGMTRDYNNTLHREAAVLEAVAQSRGAIGYAVYALYQRDPRLVKALAVDSGDGCVAPSPRTIADGSFRPFARRLYLYVSSTALARPAMSAFLRYYLDHAQAMAPRVGLVAPSDRQLAASRARLSRAVAAAGGS